jgi:hypothetical protein
MLPAPAPAAAPEPPPGNGQPPPRRPGAGSRRHLAILVLGVAAVALRVLAMIAYRPVLFYSDSVDYLKHAYQLPLSDWRPPGYSIFLRFVLLSHNLLAVAATQHVLGLATAGLLYALLLRLGLVPWAAAACCAPVLLDAYQVQIEQYVMSEALFEFLLVAALTLLARRGPGHLWRYAGPGFSSERSA